MRHAREVINFGKLLIHSAGLRSPATALCVLCYGRRVGGGGSLHGQYYIIIIIIIIITSHTRTLLPADQK